MRNKAENVVRRYVAAVNARDADAIIALLHPDCRFIDSHGFGIDGIDDCTDAVRAFMALGSNFRMHVEGISNNHGDILLRGHTEAEDASLATDTLWLARVEDGRLLYWQSFGESSAPALAHRLMPDKAEPLEDTPSIRIAN
ncbi:nuclear transport factor 2 family protein [Aurantiacibacter aquimixticola]|nr:nuclear transport factor 2 family protein [Aurantiacibacter aquimixticola]